MESDDINTEAGRARLRQLHRYAQVGGCVSGVTHDINNLLGAAMAYAELVSYDEGISADSTKMLSNIVDGITKCSQLVSSLTSISRKDRFDVNFVSPEQLMDEALVLRDYELKLRHITVECAYESSIPALPVDMAKLKIALLYLLVNAETALADAVEKKIQITVGNEEGGAFFQIWDSGPGLSPELAENAFLPFVSAWPDSENVGLGLCNARQIAEYHGGTLSYTPEGGFRLSVKRDNGLLERS